MNYLTMAKVVTAAVPLVLGGSMAAAAEGLDALVEGAKAEGGVITWCNGSIPDTAMQGVIDAFQQAYPELRLEGVRSTSQVAYQRLHQDLQMGLANCDIFSSSDYSHFTELRTAGNLLNYEPVRKDEIPASFAELYEPGYFYPGMVGTMVLATSPDLAPEDAPKSWQDLLDPRWKDRLAVGHPGYSGYVATWAIMISQLYGWDYFEEFATLNPMIGRSATDAVTQLVSGEREVAVAPGQTVFRANNGGANLRMVFPEDGVLVMSSPVAIIDNTTRPNGAKLALEFMLGAEYSRTIQQYGYDAINSTVPPLEGGIPLDQITIRRPSAEDIQALTGETIENWRDTFGG